MIKRLKWNVLYGGGGGEESDFSDASSDDSVEIGTGEATAALQHLARNDPELRHMLEEHAKASSHRAEESLSEEEDDQTDKLSNSNGSESDSENESEPHEESKEDSDTEYAEWRECQLCPGKRFLNDAEVESHLTSKKHAKSVKREEARMAAEQEAMASLHVVEEAESEDEVKNNAEHGGGQSPKLSNSALDRGVGKKGRRKETAPRKADLEKQTISAPTKSEALTPEEQRHVDKRKAAAKRKLKALKRRKWEKKMKDEQRQGDEAPSTPPTPTNNLKSHDVLASRGNGYHVRTEQITNQQNRIEAAERKQRGRSAEKTKKRVKKKRSRSEIDHDKHGLSKKMDASPQNLGGDERSDSDQEQVRSGGNKLQETNRVSKRIKRNGTSRSAAATSPEAVEENMDPASRKVNLEGLRRKKLSKKMKKRSRDDSLSNRSPK